VNLITLKTQIKVRTPSKITLEVEGGRGRGKRKGNFSNE